MMARVGWLFVQLWKQTPSGRRYVKRYGISRWYRYRDAFPKEVN